MSYLDTRDLYQELEELQTLQQEIEDAEEGEETEELDIERLNALTDLFSEIGEDAGRYGETMIPESDFEDYARELADDLGLIPSDAQWPATCIDWEQAADELRADYTSVSFDGDDYLVRLG